MNPVKFNSARKRVAYIVPGGIGTGKHHVGVPVLEQFVKSMSIEIDATVFSLFKVNEDYRPQGFRLISIKGGNLLVQSVKLLRRFAQLHRQASFDVVQGVWVLPSGFLAVLFGKIFGIKSVVSVLGGDAASLPSIGYGQLRNKVLRTAVLWTLHQADEPTSLSQFSAENLCKRGLRKPLKVIPWAIDTSRFSLKRKPLNRPVQFLHVASLSPVKDQATLLQAFRLICDQIPSMLTIIGEGPDEQELKSLTATLELNDRVRFLGLRPYDTLPAFYHQADILLQTSLSEGQGLAVTEAMCCGVVVCGTRVGLMADIPNACMTVDVGDFKSLADRVIYLLHDEAKMDEIRRTAFEWTSHHSIKWMIEETIALYATSP